MLQNSFSICKFRLTKWRFLVYSSTHNAPYIPSSHDSILEYGGFSQMYCLVHVCCTVLRVLSCFATISLGKRVLLLYLKCILMSCGNWCSVSFFRDTIGWSAASTCNCDVSFWTGFLTPRPSSYQQQKIRIYARMQFLFWHCLPRIAKHMLCLLTLGESSQESHCRAYSVCKISQIHHV